MARGGSIRIGCSGWHYPDWRGVLYPEGLGAARWLEHYATRFDTVEVNSTFYRLPAPGTLGAWARSVPSNFTFAVKASRFLTHNKKLSDPELALARFFARAAELGGALGPVLYQLPPRFARNVARLEEFLERAPRRAQAFEFRDPSWHHEDVYRVLARRGAALCVHDMPGSNAPQRALGRLVYVRLHGACPEDAAGYRAARLRGWAAWIAACAREGRDVFVYFNNDVGGNAVRDAERLAAMLARLGAIAPPSPEASRPAA